MSLQRRTKIIANPLSANGRTGKQWPRIDAVIGKHLKHYDTEFTQAPRDATRIARQALLDGYGLVVCVGGDGSINETVNGFFDGGKPVRPEAALGILPMGTGGDFVKTVGIPRDLESAVALLAEAEPRPIDVGHLSYRDHENNDCEMYFINITDFGLGGEVVYRVNNTTKILKGFLSFLWGIIRAGISYRNQLVTIDVDGASIGERRIKNVIVANGQYFGGGMRIAKNALPDDGQFDLIIMGDFGIYEGMRNMSAMYRGDIIDRPKTESFRCREVRAVAEGRVLLDVDGEQPGMLPVTLRILPSAIRVVCPTASNPA